MARMHSRKKGKAGSKKPIVTRPQPWITYSPEEVEQLVIKIAKTGKSTSQIGMILRDSYGIPDIQKLAKKKVIQILKANQIAPKIPEELTNLIKKEIILIKHLDNNKQDKPSNRGLQLTGAKIRRLTKYYKRKKMLPSDWTYSRDQAKITV